MRTPSQRHLLSRRRRLRLRLGLLVDEVEFAPRTGRATPPVECALRGCLGRGGPAFAAVDGAAFLAFADVGHDPNLLLELGSYNMGRGAPNAHHDGCTPTSRRCCTDGLPRFGTIAADVDPTR